MTRHELYTFSHLMHVWDGIHQLLENLKALADESNVDKCALIYESIFYNVEVVLDSLEKNVNKMEITEEQHEQLVDSFRYLSKEAFKAYTALKARVA